MGAEKREGRSVLTNAESILTSNAQEEEKIRCKEILPHLLLIF